MKKSKKIIFMCSVMVTIIATALFMGLDRNASRSYSSNVNDNDQEKEMSKKVYVKTVNPIIDELIITTQSGGHIERKEQKMSYESFGGRIKRIFVEEGNFVKKGDKLVELDNTATLLELQGQIQSSKASIDLLNKQIEFNQEKLDKMIQLKEAGMANAQEIAALQFQIDTFNLQLEERNQNLAIVNKSIADIKKKSIVRSKVKGTIIKSTLQIGRMTDSEDFISIIDKENLYCKAYISEKLIDCINEYQSEKVNVAITALNKVVKGEIVKIEQQEPGTKFLYPIKIKIENMDDALTNMSATAQLIIYKNKKALLIPNKAVVLDGEATYVYKVLKDNTIVRVDVKKSYYKDDLVEVEGNLKPDDRIVVEGQNKVKEGNRVEIVE